VAGERLRRVQVAEGNNRTDGKIPACEARDSTGSHPAIDWVDASGNNLDKDLRRDQRDVTWSLQCNEMRPRMQTGLKNHLVRLADGDWHIARQLQAVERVESLQEHRPHAKWASHEGVQRPRR
jgi:hypothetical protein